MRRQAQRAYGRYFASEKSYESRKSQDLSIESTVRDKIMKGSIKNELHFSRKDLGSKKSYSICNNH